MIENNRNADGRYPDGVDESCVFAAWRWNLYTHLKLTDNAYYAMLINRRIITSINGLLPESDYS